MIKKFLFIICLLITSFSYGQDVLKPSSPPKLVNDAADMLSTEQEQALERKLYTYDDSTSNQIVIVTVTTLNGLDPADYAVKLGREWGVGGKDYNNGVVILISNGVNENGKREAFIATGYGLEGRLPDITCTDIVESRLIPNLKTGNAYQGLELTTDAIIQAIAGEYKAPENYHKRKGGGISIGKIIGIIIFLIIIGNIGNRGRGGGMMSRRGYRGFSNPIFWLPTGGGGWSGGGGGGSSGGFGGFGGGSFGGGGGGGNW